MRLIETGIPGAVIVEPAVHRDERGYFMELWQSSRYRDYGLPERFVQVNISQSGKGVVRGLHYQYPQGQGKLVSVLEGRVFDVAVDIRSDSPTFKRWVGVELSAENHRQFYVPEGFAHGFCVLGKSALLGYLCTAEYSRDFDAAINWNDPDLGIRWPTEADRASPKDARAPRLRDIAIEDLPRLET